MQVARRRDQIGMPQQLLGRRQIPALAQKARGERMP